MDRRESRSIRNPQNHRTLIVQGLRLVATSAGRTLIGGDSAGNAVRAHAGIAGVKAGALLSGAGAANIVGGARGQTSSAPCFPIDPIEEFGNALWRD